MTKELFDGLWPLNREEMKRYQSEDKIQNAWLSACSANEFAIGVDLVSGGRCFLVGAKDKPVKFRQFEGAHKEMLQLGLKEFDVNAENWIVEQSYDKFKAQYAARNRDKRIGQH